MIRNVASAAVVLLAVFGWFSAQAQVSLTTPGSPVVIGFTGFDGTGFTPTPAAGQLDSDDWEINGFSTGPLTFGGTQTAGDFAKGVSGGGVSGGGCYAFEVGGTGGNVAMGVQPTGSDWTPGDFILRMQNNTGAVIVDLGVAYTLYVNNNENRGNSFNFAHSSDNSTYTAEASLDYSSTETSQGSVLWDSLVQTITLSGVNIPAGDFYYIKWDSDDDIGGGSRDEFALDNITLTPGGGATGLTANFTTNNNCIGDSTAFVDLSTGNSGPLTYSWDFEGLGTSTDAAPNFLFPAAASYEVILVVTDSAGSVDSVAIDVDVFGLPTVATSNDTTICALDTAMLSASGASTYAWTPGGNLGDPTAASTIATPTNTTTYTVTGTSADGCVSTDNVLVTVDASASPEILGDYSFCANDAPSPIMAASTGGTWSGTGITNASAGTFSPAVAGLGTWTVTYTTTGACSGVDSVDVIVFNQPANAGIFFSEYIESAGDKALEIFNAGDTAVDLSNCFIIRNNNGGTANPDTFWMNGLLQPLDVYVIAASGAGPAIQAVADTTGSATFYNGNDALQLWCGADEMDRIGIPGNDPGNGGWTAGNGSTEDNTLVRWSTVYEGDTAWTGTVENQWTAYPFTNHTFLGSHTLAMCNVPDGPVALFSATTSCEGTQTDFTDASVTDLGSVTGWAWDFGDASGTSAMQHPSYTYGASGDFTVTLIVTTDSMDSDTTTMMVTVNPTPVAAFGVNSATGCTPFIANFSDSSSIDTTGSIASWAWDFGNGNTSAMQNPTDTFGTAGMYTIWLNVTSDLGCVDSASTSITVGDAPVLNEGNMASANANCGASDGSVTGATATGAGTLTYEWFDAGNTSVGNTVDLTAVASGSFTLVVTDTLGCTDSSGIYTIINVGGPGAPTVAGGGSYCEGATVSALTATGSGGTITWYADSTLGTQLDTGATYIPLNLPAGTTTIYATETGACEGPYSSQTINVNPKPVASVVTDVTGGCVPLMVNFTDSTTIASGSYTVTNCDMGDGFVSGTVPSPYTYTTAGQYTALCVFTSDSGCVDSASNVITVTVPPMVDAGSDTSVCVGDAVQLTGVSAGTTCSWSPAASLSDPNILNPMASPTVDTDYILTCADSVGCAASDTVFVSVLTNAPVAVDAAGPFCVNGAAAQLVASQSGGTWAGPGVDAGAGTFNPGVAGLGMHQIIYTTAGSCGSADTIMVEVTTGATGATDLFFSEYLEGSSNNKALEIYNPLDVAVNLTGYYVNRYNNGTTTLSGSDTLSGMLQPGDVYVIANSSSTGAIIAEADLVSNNSTLFNGDDHLQLMNGTTIIDGIGELGVDPGSSWPVGSGATNENTLVRMGSIVSGNTTWTGGGDTEWDVHAQDDFSFLGWHSALVCSSSSITAEFNATEVCEGDTTQFTDLSVTTGTITTWAWDFGDAATSAMQNPTHVYAASGTYAVTLIITDDSSNVDTVTNMVEVFSTPAASFTLDANSGCTPMMVNATNTTTGGNTNTYAWDFGDGNMATTESPSNEFVTAGSFTVSLVVTSADGCTSTVTDMVTTIDGIVVDDSNAAQTDANCGSLDGAVSGITAVGNGPVSYIWEDALGTQVGTAADLSGVTGGTYSLFITDSIGCVDSSNVYTLANIGGPAAPTVAGVADYCDGETVSDLTATGGAGTFIWFTDAALTMPIDSGATTTPTLVAGANELWVIEVTACAGPATMVSMNLSPTPTVAFTASDTAGCAPLSVTFTNGSSISSGTLTYNWTFGDGESSTDTDPTHLFDMFTGVHTVELTATSDAGCAATLTQVDLVNVFPVPNADFSWVATPDAGGMINFTDLSSLAVSWSWDFGNGTNSTDQDPIANYDSSITYFATLVVTSADGCTATATDSIPVSVGGSVQDLALALRLKAYPNPSNGTMTLDLGQVPVTGTMDVLNPLGQVVATERLKAKTGRIALNLNDLPNGQYILRLNGENGFATKRLMIMK